MNDHTDYYFSSFHHQNDETTPTNPIPVPIHFPSPPPPATQIPVHFPTSVLNSAATKIQSSFRAHLTRSLLRKISSVRSDADRMERTIQRQDTVDAVRSDERERARVNEGLMALLLRLDSVPGRFDPNVREMRRDLSRRIVALQGILDGIVAGTEMDGGYCVGIPGSLGELLENIWLG